MKYFILCLLFAFAVPFAWSQTLLSNFPQTSGPVHAAEIDGHILYIGGEFTSVNGAPRNRVAAIDLQTLQVLPWDPDADGTVVDIRSADGTVYLAGAFQQVGGQARNNIAAVDAQSGNVTAWNPNIVFPGIPGMQTGSIAGLDVSGDTVYIAGYFISVDGQSISNLAALRSSDATPYNWDPAPNVPVNLVRVRGNEVYFAGPFFSVGSTSHAGIAVADRTSGAVSSWYPSPDNQGNEWNDLFFDGTDTYLAGPFTNLGATSVNLCAKVDANANAYSAWNPGFNFSPGNYKPIRALTKFMANIIAGGDFDSFQNGHQYLVALNPTNAQAIPWFPNLNQRVRDLITKGDTLIVVGDFNLENGNARQGIAAYVSPSTHIPDPVLVEVTVFPNPAQEILNIQSPETIFEVRLTDVSGRKVYARSHLGADTHFSGISVKDFSSGIYLLEVITEAGPFREKVVLR